MPEVDKTQRKFKPYDSAIWIWKGYDLFPDEERVVLLLKEYGDGNRWLVETEDHKQVLVQTESLEAW